MLFLVLYKEIVNGLTRAIQLYRCDANDNGSKSRDIALPLVIVL